MKNTNTTSLSAAINRTMADSSVARCEYHRIYGVPWAPLPVQAVALIDAIDERGESLLLEIVEMRDDDATLAISDGIETRRVAALSLDTCAASPRSMRTAN